MRYHMVFVLSLFAVTLFQVTAVAQPSCSVGSLGGTWAAESQGTVFATAAGSTVPAGVPGSALGLVSIGYGGEIHVELTSATGTNLGDITMDGTLTVNADCTGTLSSVTSNKWELHEQIVILDKGNEVWTIAVGRMANRPAVWQCKWRRISPGPLPMFANSQKCSVDTIAGTWASSYNGVVLQPGADAPFPVALVTLGTYDFGGKTTGRWTASLGGQVMTGTATGWIEVNPDCTGKSQTVITADNGVRLGEQTRKLVILNDGNEIWAMTIKGMSPAPNIGLDRQYRISPAVQK